MTAGVSRGKGADRAVKSGFGDWAGAEAGVGAGATAGAAVGEGAGASAGAGAAAGGLAGSGRCSGAGAAPISIRAMAVPMETSSPSGTRIFRRPVAGDSSSLETLSVSIKTRTSPCTTESPSFRRHEATLAEVIDSPEAGTMRSTEPVLGWEEGAGAGAETTSAGAAATTADFGAEPL